MPEDIYFTLIADPVMLAGYGQPELPQFNVPAINEDGTVAFRAYSDPADPSDGPQRYVIYSASGAAPTVIADDAAGINRITSSTVSINEAGTVSFVGALSGNDQSILSGVGGGLTTIATEDITLTPEPSDLLFRVERQTAINNAGTVSFVGRENMSGIVGIFAGSGGALTRVIDDTGPVDLFYDSIVSNNHGVAFRGKLDSGDTGVYFSSGGGALTTIADDSGSFTFVGPPSMNDNDKVAFVALDNSGVVGVYTGDGSALTTVVKTSRANVDFTSFSSVAINNDNKVAFTGHDGLGAYGLYAASGDLAIPGHVITVGDKLYGDVIQEIRIGPEAFNDAGQIAFQVVFADGEAIYRAEPVRPKLAIDWDTQLSRDFVIFTDAVTGKQSVIDIEGREALPIFPDGFDVDAYKQAVKQEVTAIFDNSGIPIEIVDSSTEGVMSVRFGQGLPYDADGDGNVDNRLLGKAYDISPVGFPGIDQFNLRSDGEVAVFVDPTLDSFERVAETIAHEAGHGFGLRHINPSTGSQEVMDYSHSAGVLEQFSNVVANITEKPVPGGKVYSDTHNPIYHLRRYLLGEEPDDLNNHAILPGTWDLTLSELIEIGLDEIESEILGDELYNMTAMVGLGPGEFDIEDSPSLLKFQEVLGLGSLAEMDLISYADFPLLFRASSEPGSLWDLFFGFGDPSDPEFLFDNLADGLLAGSIFQFGGTGFEVVGSFKMNIANGGMITPDGYLPPPTVPEPSTLAMGLLGMVGLAHCLRIK